MKQTRIKNYDKLWYNDTPVKYSDYVSNKYNDIHKQLYNDAVNKLLNDIYIDYGCENLDAFLGKIKIIEIKNNEYWKPSSIIIKFTSNHENGDKKIIKGSILKYDLTKYWNTYQNKNYDRHIGECNIISDNIPDPEILNINYVKGEVTVESRMNDLVYKTNTDYMQTGDKYSEEFLKNH